MALDFPSAPATGDVYQSYVYDGVKWSATQFGSGGVAGPASSTDNAIVRFNGTTGNIVQNSTTFLLGDAGEATLTGTFSLNGSATFTSGLFAVIGTVAFTSGAFTVVGTANFTGGAWNATTAAFNVNGTTTFTAAQFGVIGTATFTANAFGIIGTTNITGTFRATGTTTLASVGTGILIANAGVVTTAGGLVLLNTLTPSNVASTNDTSSFTANYKSYMFELNNVCPVSNTATLQMTLCTTGSAFTTAGYLSQAQCNVSAIAVWDSTTASILLNGTRATTGCSSSLVYGLHGIVYLLNPASSTAAKMVNGHLTYLAGTGSLGTNFLGLSTINAIYNGTTSPVTGVNFVFQAGNIATGTIKIYGIT